MRQGISVAAVAVASATAAMRVALAETCRKNGRAEEGLELVAEGLELAERTGLSLVLAQLHRVKGDLLMIRDSGNAAEAERCLRTAIDVARRQDARLFELRATVSLARLLASQGHSEEARAMLADIYGWFTEGFEFADLQDAKALLEELNN